MAGWVRGTVAAQTRACRPPFSFYFDLIHWLWRSKPSNPQPLHRLCTLARKQNASFLVIEPAFDRPGISDELDALDAASGGGGEFEAIAISFFASDRDDYNQGDAGEDTLVGTLTLINQKRAGDTDFCLSYVYEAIFRRPLLESKPDAQHLLNNFSFSSSIFRVIAGGKQYDVDGVYYCQQNGITHRCAQSCLRMALNTIAGDGSRFPPSLINKLSGVTDPADGLSLKQLIDVVHSSGLPVQAHVIPCKSLKTEQFIANIAGFVESGVNVLIVFSTSTDQHVVTCFGYTQNTDEWHPQALPAYSGPASTPFFASALWTDHLVIHDDNFGPYYTLNSRALSIDPDIKPEWIIALTPSDVTITPVGAQAIAAVTMAQTVLGLLGRGQWFTFIKQGNHLVYRPTMVSKDEYLSHLEAFGHDGTRMSPTEIALLSGLPPSFWMVEFSTPSLYTGNHSKLGEVIVNPIDFDQSNIYASVLAMRLPSLILLPDKSGPQFRFHHVSMSSHTPILDVGDHSHRW